MHISADLGKFTPFFVEVLKVYFYALYNKLKLGSSYSETVYSICPLHEWVNDCMQQH